MHMNPKQTLRRVTINVPIDLLNDAIEVAQANITDTILEGLQILRQRKALRLAKKLIGKVSFDINLDESRGRNRR